jgi:glycosyltransferase involved in cell wall biosynthesis
MVIVHIIPSLTYGGAEKVLHAVTTKSNGIKHRIFTLTDSNPMESLFLNDQVLVERFPLHKFRAIWALVKSIALLKKNNKNQFIIMSWLYHGCSMSSLLFILFPKINQVWTIHNANVGFGVVSWRVIISTLISGIFSHFVPRKILYCSESAFRYHRKLGFKSSVAEVVENGIDCKRFDSNARVRRIARQRFQIPQGMLVLTCVARWDAQKDHKTLLHAVSIVRTKLRRDFKLILCGLNIDDENPNLNRLLSFYGLNDVVVKLSRVDDIENVYRSSDVLILSSISEALPNVLVEAMLSRVLCVSTNVGDIHKIIGSEGWLVPPRSPVLLAHGILDAIEALSNFDMLDARQQRARQRVIEHFSLETMISRYKKAWILALE